MRKTRIHLRQNGFSPLDALILMVLTAFCGFLLYQAAVKLEYHWNWGVIPQFILRHDSTTGTWHAGTLLLGLFMTLRLSLWGSVLALSFGIIFGLLRISNHLYWRLIAGTYVGLVRNTPPLVIVFVFYFFIGDQIMNAFSVNTFAYGLAAGDHPLFALLFGPTDQLPQILSAIITIGLFEGAYIAEIVRAGIESIEQGQWEASCSLGFNRNQQLRHVILPQALQRMIPALAGQFISTIKDSAIVAVISIQELTFQGLQLMTTTYRTFEIWITVLCMYFILTFMCSLILHRLEHNFARN